MYIIVSNGSNGNLETFDISNPSSIQNLNSVAQQASSTGSLAINGRYLYYSNTTSLLVYDTGGIYTQSLQAGSADTNNLTVDSGAIISGGVSVNGGISDNGNAQINGNLGVNGSATFSAPNNSVSAFQFQNAVGYNQLSVDTTNSNVNVGGQYLGNILNSPTNVSAAVPTGAGGAASAGAALSGGNFYYVLPGGSGTVYYAQTNSDGNFNSFTAASNPLPGSTVLYGAQMVVDTTHNYIYVIGGYVAAPATSYANNVIYYATVNPSTGAIGSWSSASMSWGVALGAAYISGGNLFVIGGSVESGGFGCSNLCILPFSAGSQLQYYQVFPLSSGVPGSETGASLPAGIPITNYQFGSNGTNLYLWGGINASDATVQTLYTGSISGSTITWTANTTIDLCYSTTYQSGGVYANGYLVDVTNSCISATNGAALVYGFMPTTTLGNNVTSTAVVGNYIYSIKGTNSVISGIYVNKISSECGNQLKYYREHNRLRKLLDKIGHKFNFCHPVHECIRCGTL